MASFYLDHDVHRGTQPALQSLGHEVVRTRELRLERVDDATQLLIAARAGRIIVTHNERDYKLLQRAWTDWPAQMVHVGILLVPQQRWTTAQTARHLGEFVRAAPLLANALYWWTVVQGWLRFT